MIDHRDESVDVVPALSVVVIGRNEGERLVHCLTSVRAMRPIEGGIEIIYVDSASTDGSAERAAALGAIVLRVAPAQPSAALGRNIGWRRARAPYVLFLDGDTVLHPGFVAASLSEFADPRVAVVWGHRRELRPASLDLQPRPRSRLDLSAGTVGVLRRRRAVSPRSARADRRLRLEPDRRRGARALPAHQGA